MLHKTSAIFLALFTFMSVVFLLRFALLGQAVYGDGRYYYAYVRSTVIDHDLNFINEMGHRYDHRHNNEKVENDADVLAPNTKTQLLENKYPIGAPLLWLTPYTTANVLADLISQLDKSFPNNGYSNIYQLYIGIFNIALVVGGLFTIYRLLLKFYNKKVATLTVIGVALGSN